jgi:hypothetical protein
MRREARSSLQLVGFMIAVATLGYGLVVVRAPSRQPVAGAGSVASALPSIHPPTHPSTPPPLGPSLATAVAATAPGPQELSVDEATLMTALRGLRGAKPEQALALARHGNAAFPDGTAGAERGWIIVRSLEELRRFHEAQTEARAMRERYPGTAWTEDVERHTLINPLDLPSREAQQAAD